MKRIIPMSEIYTLVGGSAFFERLVDEFYKGVARDPALLTLYPQPDDLAESRRRLTLFLVQYWGGPSAYSEERGHPRLRLRHAPFPIDSAAADRWLGHMRAALDTMIAEGLDDALAATLWAYFVPAADAMRNV